MRLLVFKLETDVSSLLLLLILFLLEAVCTGYTIVFLYLIIIFLVTLLISDLLTPLLSVVSCI